MVANSLVYALSYMCLKNMLQQCCSLYIIYIDNKLLLVVLLALVY
jgi:hypothetical protein